MDIMRTKEKNFLFTAYNGNIAERNMVPSYLYFRANYNTEEWKIILGASDGQNYSMNLMF